MLKALRRSLLAPVDIPQYVAVGLHEPQALVEVWLHGAGKPRDVTANNVVVALRPFTIGVMAPPQNRPGLSPSRCRLRFLQRGSRRLMGVIRLRAVRTIALADRTLELFETEGSANYCLSAPHRFMYHEFERWKNRRRQRKTPFNFQMTHDDLRALFTFYICPRPVVLVTVAHGESSNIFPMDLIGPTDSPWFSLALRSTSPSVSLIRNSRRVALGSVPLSEKALAYELGQHHAHATIDWNQLTLETLPSPVLGLRVARSALRVRELQVEHVHEVGSHVLFLASVLRDTIPAQAPAQGVATQLFHVHGTYWRFLQRHGASLPERSL